MDHTRRSLLNAGAGAANIGSFSTPKLMAGSDTIASGFPDIAVGPKGDLYVVEALAGASGLYRFPDSGPPELVLSGPGLVGVAFFCD